jgi:heat shock protein HslJ
MRVSDLTRLVRLSAASALLAILLPGAAAGQAPAASQAPSPPIPQASVPITPEVRPEGTWTVTGYDLTGGGLVAPLRGSRLTVSFLPAGRLEGETPCGTYLGGYTLDGETLRLGIIGMGSERCGARREDEAFAFTQALSLASRWAPTDDGLGLLDEAGQLRLALILDAATSIVGDWQVRALARGRDGLRPLAEGTSLSISFEDAGDVGGSTGCRELSGRYETQTDVLIIAPLAVVGLPCDGPEARQERRFLALLDRVTTWQRDGELLRFRDDSSEVLLEAEAARAAGPEGTPAPSLPAADVSPSATLVP